MVLNTPGARSQLHERVRKRERERERDERGEREREREREERERERERRERRAGNAYGFSRGAQIPSWTGLN